MEAIAHMSKGGMEYSGNLIENGRIEMDVCRMGRCGCRESRSG